MALLKDLALSLDWKTELPCTAVVLLCFDNDDNCYCFFQAFKKKKSGLIYINYSYILIVNSTHLLQGASASQKYTKLYTVALTNVKFVNRCNFWFENVFVNVHIKFYNLYYWM